MKKDENHWFSLLFFLSEKRMKSVETFCCFLCVSVFIFAGFFLLFFFKFKATFLIRFMSYDALHEDVKLHINADLFL